MATSIFQKYSEKGMTGMDILVNAELEEEVILKFNNQSENIPQLDSPSNCEFSIDLGIENSNN